MSGYCVHFYGLNLTEYFDEIQESCDFELSDYIENENIGGHIYDGGGYGQCSYLGCEIEKSPNGYVVTPEIIEKARQIIAGLSDELKAALAPHFPGNLIDHAEFDMEVGIG